MEYTVVMLLVAAVVICLYLKLSSRTTQLVLEATLALAVNDEDIVEAAGVNDDADAMPYRIASHRAVGKAARVDGFKGGWHGVCHWGKRSIRSHHNKGITLADYRKGNHLRKKLLHPCVG